MIVSTLKNAAEGLTLFYPGSSLLNQINTWLDRHDASGLLICNERQLPAIREQLRQATLVLVDATEDAAQASDVLIQASNSFGVNEVAVYSDVMHDDLEVFVRTMGAPMLLGPMAQEEWDGFLYHKYPRVALQGAKSGTGRKRAA